MVIREAGILFRGFTLISKKYKEISEDSIDEDLRSGLLVAIINFAEAAFSNGILEYLQGGKYVIAFKQDKIRAIDSIDPELLIGYCILDATKKKNIDKYISKTVQPLLSQATISFCSKYDGKNLSEVSQFKIFRNVIERIFPR